MRGRAAGQRGSGAVCSHLGMDKWAFLSARLLRRSAFLPPGCPAARLPRYNCPMLKRVYIETYGCQMNVADSELMFGVLGREGYARADRPEDADVMLVNTCAVREKGPTAFVTVQRGCDYRCTFCIVPQTRGPERSRRLADVEREVTGLVGQGATEVTLLGQTVNSYHDGEHDFADLLRAVGGIDGLRRIRFTSPYPTDFTPRVVEAIATTPAVCEHVHLPVQSGSNSVLRRMLRRYTRERYLEVVAELRGAVPGITLSTDLIVGFPGETEEQFDATLSLVTQADFDDAYTFKYSVREGTPAVRLKDHVTDEVASDRLDRLIEVVRANVRRKNMARIGQTHEVLVERPARRGDLMLARTRTNQLVLLDLPAAAIGEYHTVRLTGSTGSTFTGAVVVRAQLAVL